MLCQIPYQTQSSIILTSFAEVSNAFDAELPVKERIFEIWLDKFVGKFCPELELPSK